MSDESLSQSLFQYPQVPHQRLHGPLGYTDYRAYKPWLRDEFTYRCVYCLCRERWFPTGEAAFSVDHLQPQVSNRDRVCEYDNLVYACSHCNAAKRDFDKIPDPCQQAYGDHLRMHKNGRINGLTIEGAELIDYCHLNRTRLIEFRQRMLTLCKVLEMKSDAESSILYMKYFGYPENLLQLSLLRPPRGNLNPDGIIESCFELLNRGELAATY